MRFTLTTMALIGAAITLVSAQEDLVCIHALTTRVVCVSFCGLIANADLLRSYRALSTLTASLAASESLDAQARREK